MNIREQVGALVERIRQGDIMGAFEDYYADDVAMQENAKPPVQGKDANRKREQAFLDGVKEWKGLEIKAVGAEGDGPDGATFIEYAFDFINQQDRPVRYEQVAVQRWKDGKIVHERFYYDASGG